MQGIYLIVNKINQNCYVGQSIDIIKRWWDHKSLTWNKNSKAYNYPLYRAFRKYNIENFEFLVLEELPDASSDKLLEREIFWYKTIKPKYSQIHPTKKINNKRARPIVQIDQITLQVVNVFKSHNEAARVIKGNHGAISNVCNKRGLSAYGYYWCYQDEFNNFTAPTHNKKRKTVQIDPLTNKIIKTFNSAIDAAKYIEVSGTTIRVAAYQNKQAAGYLWSYI